MPNAVVDAYKEQINQLTRRREDAANRLNAILKTADEIRATIATMDELLLSLQAFLHSTEGKHDSSPIQHVSSSDTDSNVAKKKRASGNSKKEDVAHAAKEILRASGRPLSRAELYPLLIDQGLRIEGANPEMVLSTMLWRAGRAMGIIRLKSGGYDLIERRRSDESISD